MPSRALIMGVDRYRGGSELTGCVREAERVADRMDWNQDGSRNFETTRLYNPTRVEMRDAIQTLFSRRLEMAVLYFSGHGAYDKSENKAYLVSSDGVETAWGMSLSEIMRLANEAYPTIGNTVIILDCCYSGDMGTCDYSYLFNRGDLALVGTGVTIMTASQRDEQAFMEDGRSVFTRILLQGLDGEAADVVGQITPAALYTHIDRSLPTVEQRPLYKANVERFSTIRRVNSTVSELDLRALPALFPTPESHYGLDPSCEPLTVADRADRYESTLHIPFDPKKHIRYRLLQKFNRKGLVDPLGCKNMWNAAVDSKSCELTQRGRHYHYLANRGRFGQPHKNLESITLDNP